MAVRRCGHSAERQPGTGRAGRDAFLTLFPTANRVIWLLRHKAGLLSEGD